MYETNYTLMINVTACTPVLCLAPPVSLPTPMTYHSLACSFSL